MTAVSTPKFATGELWGHPKGLYVCFATEMWERFSFYGMKYLLLLYLTKYHLFSDSAGLDVLGAYAGLVYALPVIGGLIADRYLGTRKSVVLGGILLAVGHLLMAVEGEQAVSYAVGTVLNDDLVLADGRVFSAGTQLGEAITARDTRALSVFYLALAFIVVGVGYLKPNISVIVGKLYPENDPRRDSGFTIFYMGINVGSFIATMLCGYIGETYGWKYGFGLAGIGMLIGLATFLYGQRYLMGYAEPPPGGNLGQRVAGPINREQLIYIASLPAIALTWFLVQSEPVVHIAQNILLVGGIVGILTYAMVYHRPRAEWGPALGFGAITFAVGLLTIFLQNGLVAPDSAMADVVLSLSLILLVAFLIFGYTKYFSKEFSRMAVLMALIVSTIVFWSLFEQSAGSMTLFADRVMDKSLLGMNLVASQFAALNPFFIMTLSIPFALLWPWLEKRNANPSTPVKFAIGIVFAGLGFGALVVGAQFPNDAGKVAAIWMVLAYFLHSTGELCLSPIGLSAVTKLALPKVVGISMGTWFVATALSETVAFRLSKFAALDENQISNPAQALGAYTELFTVLFWTGLVFGLIFFGLSYFLKKGMYGVK